MESYILSSSEKISTAKIYNMMGPRQLCPATYVKSHQRMETSVLQDFVKIERETLKNLSTPAMNRLSNIESF